MDDKTWDDVNAIFEGVDQNNLTWEARERVFGALVFRGVEDAKVLLAEILQANEIAEQLGKQAKR